MRPRLCFLDATRHWLRLHCNLARVPPIVHHGAGPNCCLGGPSHSPLVAPCCASHREIISAIPPRLRAMGFLVSQHGQLGAMAPSPLSERFPLGEHAKWRCESPPPPPQKGISAILARYPVKTRQTRAIPPSAILSRKGIAQYGGVS